MKKIIKVISNDFHTSRIELSKKAFKANLRFVKQIIGTEPIIFCVVKGNAYGHGIESFVPLAESCGVNHFAVANADEALRVFENSTGNSEILVMSSMEKDALEWVIKNSIQFHVFDLGRLQAAVRNSWKTRKAGTNSPGIGNGTKPPRP